MTNLKLCEYYLKKRDFLESKRYFTRSLSKLLNDNSIFQIKIGDKKAESFFSYLTNFILSFPSFNLANQPNLNLKLKVNTDNDVNSKQNQVISSHMHKKSGGKNDVVENLKEKNKINMILNQENSEIIKEKKYIEMKRIEMENGKEEQIYESATISEKEIKMNEEEKTFKSGKEIFEFIILNDEYKKVFDVEINKIIQIMNDIIYTPPYPILFGRINISKYKPKKVQKYNQKEINELFYEGLGFDEFKYVKSS